MIRITVSAISFKSRGDCKMGQLCAIDPSVAGSSPADRLSIFPKSEIPQCF